MRPLRRRSVKVYKRLSAGPMLPPWVKVLPFALGALVLLLVSSLLFDSTKPSIVEQDRMNADVDRMIGALDDVLTTTQAPIDDPAASTIPQGSTATPTTPPATEPPPANPTSPQEGTPVTVTLQQRGGGAVQVDERALQLARAATVALFTGDFSKIPLGDGVTVPLLNRTWPDPYVGEPVVVSMADGVLALAFRVDPDRNGGQVLREVTTYVGASANGWVWLGV